MSVLVTGAGAGATTLLDVIDPYEITMVVVEEMTFAVQQLVGSGGYLYKHGGRRENEKVMKIRFWLARPPWVKYLYSDM